MLCGVAAAAGGGALGLFFTWATLTLLALPTTMLLSTVVFRGFYWRPTVRGVRVAAPGERINA